MASHKSPPPPPIPTTILALGDDLLREIFLRLPSLPSLVRAAFACRAFLNAVHSSPAFRPNFLARRPPPLLGFFFDPDDPYMPSFAPIRRRSDRDLAAAVRGSDFFLTLLPDDDDDDASPGWGISDYRQGNLLLVNCHTGKLAVYNPITGALDLIPPPPDEMLDGMLQAGLGNGTYLDCLILSPEDGGGPPPRLLYSCHHESRIRAAAFSCDTREWQAFPWPPQAATPQFDEDNDLFRLGAMVNGFVYWARGDDACMLELNAATLEFSQIRLPSILEGRGYISMVGRNKDGKLCMVFPLEFTLHVWVWGTNADGIGSWVFDKKFPLDLIAELAKEYRQLRVVAVIDGFVYFSTRESSDDYTPSSWFLSLCMETAEVDRLFQKKFDCHVHPYVMSWPPALVDNKVHPQLEGA